MALILNIETTTNICSICLAQDGEVIAYEESQEQNAHSSYLSYFIEKMFTRSIYHINDLEAIAISKGPGSYTGLRIGTSVAKGLAYALTIPLLAISTLKHMALGAQKMVDAKEAYFSPMLDARRMEFYTAVLDHFGHYVIEPTSIDINEELFYTYPTNHDIYFFGSGINKAKDILRKYERAKFLDEFQMSSTDMVGLAENAFANREFENLAYFSPMYLKEFIPDRNKKGG